MYFSNQSIEEKVDENVPIEEKRCCRKGEKEDEQVRLGAHKPLPTLLQQSAGPICSQVVTSLSGIVNSFWVSKSIGAEVLTVMGVVSILEAVNNAFGQYVSACVAARISFLFGEKRNEECAQVFVDVMRVSLLLSLLVPVLILSITKPISKWFGADSEIQQLGFEYLIPITCLTFIYQEYLVCCGLLQACGLSWIYGVCQAVSLFLLMAVFDPLLLLGLHTPIWGASLAYILSVLLPFIVLFILIFIGKFDVKPKMNMFCKKFAAETKHALNVGISTLIENLSASLPDIAIQKFLGEAANEIDKYNVILSVWNLEERLFVFIICVCVGFAQGLLPAASYAYGAKRNRRVRNLALHCFWLGTVWLVCVEVIIVSNSYAFSGIWLKDPEFQGWAKKILNNAMYTLVLYMFRYTSITTLQATEQIMVATIQSVITLLLPIPMFSCIMFFAFKHDPVRVIQAFIWSDIWGAVVCIIIAAWKLKFLFNPPPTDTGEIDNAILSNEGEEEKDGEKIHSEIKFHDPGIEDELNP